MTYEPPFTIEDLEAKVREIAQARPDHIYVAMLNEGKQACYYAADSTLENQGWEYGCIIGQALHALDPSLDHDKGDVLIGDATFGDYVSELLELIGLPYSPLLERVQSHQDEGRSWGEALKEAEKEIRA